MNNSSLGATDGGNKHFKPNACKRVFVLKRGVDILFTLRPNIFITALHGMQTRYSDEKAVRPSAFPSVKRVDCDKTKERSVQIFIPYERSFSLV